jgi:hypothetical protein
VSTRTRRFLVSATCADTACCGWPRCFSVPCATKVHHWYESHGIIISHGRILLALNRDNSAAVAARRSIVSRPDSAVEPTSYAPDFSPQRFSRRSLPSSTGHKSTRTQRRGDQPNHAHHLCFKRKLAPLPAGNMMMGHGSFFFLLSFSDGGCTGQSEEPFFRPNLRASSQSTPPAIGKTRAVNMDGTGAVHSSVKSQVYWER